MLFQALKTVTGERSFEKVETKYINPAYYPIDYYLGVSNLLGSSLIWRSQCDEGCDILIFAITTWMAWKWPFHDSNSWLYEH